VPVHAPVVVLYPAAQMAALLAPPLPPAIEEVPVDVYWL